MISVHYFLLIFLRESDNSPFLATHRYSLIRFVFWMTLWNILMEMKGNPRFSDVFDSPRQGRIYMIYDTLCKRVYFKHSCNNNYPLKLHSSSMDFTQKPTSSPLPLQISPSSLHHDFSIFTTPNICQWCCFVEKWIPGIHGGGWGYWWMVNNGS